MFCCIELFQSYPSKIHQSFRWLEWIFHFGILHSVASWHLEHRNEYISWTTVMLLLNYCALYKVKCGKQKYFSSQFLFTSPIWRKRCNSKFCLPAWISVYFSLVLGEMGLPLCCTEIHKFISRLILCFKLNM